MKLFQLFYKLGDNEQWNYLIGLLQLLFIKRHRNGKYDDANDGFIVPDNKSSLVRVCKKTFMDIFAITTQKVTARR